MKRAALLVISLAFAACVPAATPAPSPAAEQPVAAALSALEACAAAAQVTRVETPVPTPPPAAPPATSTPAPPPAAAPPPPPTPLPAPTVDRVGYPEGYEEQFKLFFIYERPNQVRVVCGNDIAASRQQGEPFPYGSVLVFESWRPKRDASGNLVKDEKGHYVRESSSGIFVQRKEQGFGEAYGARRSGEWEYAGYGLDKRPSAGGVPERTGPCASCHVAAGPQNDYVFRDNLRFTAERIGQASIAGPNEVVFDSVVSTPANLNVKVGATVTWLNKDDFPHTATANNGAFDSKIVPPGGSFAFTFDTPGTFDYVCQIHPIEQKGTVRVAN